MFSLGRAWLAAVAAATLLAARATAGSDGVAFAAFVAATPRAYRGNGAPWQASAKAVAAAFKAWFPQADVSLTGGATAAELREYLASVPADTDAPLAVVYLSAHVQKDGRWRMSGGKPALWQDLLAEADMPPHRGRIVLLDVCHAARVAKSITGLCGADGAVLAAADAGERTYALNTTRRQPVDLRKRFPAAVDWLRTALGQEWDGRISYLGFVWVLAFLETPAPPRSRTEWHEFLHECERISDEFPRRRARRLTSHIHTP
jgi:hypothetical protein